MRRLTPASSSTAAVMALTARTAFVIGSLGGAIECLVAAIKKVVFFRLVFQGPDFWWLAPLVSGALAAAVALAVVGLLRMVRPSLADAARYGVPCVLLAANALLLVPGLHAVSVWLVALGIGLQGGRWLQRRGPRIDRLVTHAWVPLMVLPTLSGLGLRVVARVEDRAQVAASQAAHPNILLVVLDAVRPTELSAYGFDLDTTPFLKGLAARGVLFRQAYSVAPWTAPGHAGMFTGHWADELSVNWVTPLDGRFETLAQALSKQGYRTAAVVGNSEFASREVFGAGFQFFSDYRTTLLRLTTVTALERWLWRRPTAVSWLTQHNYPTRVPADEVTGEFLHWLDRGSSAGPFFAFLNYFDAHAQYFPPRTYWDQFAPPGEPYHNPELPIRTHWTAHEVEVNYRAYLACIKYLDAKLAELFAELEQRGALTNTLVIVTADHGEEFHEHGVMGHGNSLYVQSLEVPLIMVWPGHLPSGHVVKAPVTTREIPATLMELLGEAPTFPGPSLVPRWSPGAQDAVVSDDVMRFEVRFTPQLPPAYPVSHGPLSAVLQSGFWHLSTADGTDQLYDDVADPGQMHDLASDGRYRDALERMRNVHRDAFAETAATRR